MNKQIHPNTQIGKVSLTVSNLERSIAFYQQLGLTLRHQENNVAHLGTPNKELLELHENPRARQVRGTTGLYHFAILLPTRVDLALALYNMGQQQVQLQGYSDHLVSEAIYLADPDGNGIEVYRDRLRDEWQYDTNGTLRMATEPLNIDSLLGELNNYNGTWSGFPDGTMNGHVHLHVGDLAKVTNFYTKQMGFDYVVGYGSQAGFVSAGGYHHHIGMNTWSGVNAPPPPEDAIGLRWYELVLPNQAALDEIKGWLEETAVSHTTTPDGIHLHDPAQNGILLTTP